MGSADILVGSNLMYTRWPRIAPGAVAILLTILVMTAFSLRGMDRAFPSANDPQAVLLLTGLTAIVLSLSSAVRARSAEPLAVEEPDSPGPPDDAITEQLAIALDTRDVLTHRHTRRVQSYALRLARELHMNERTFLERLQAAALLHDVGKLAMPDRILNKPGALTAAEMETMKLHAELGADLLAAIGVDESVVAFVRHHHESWNGAGYPARLCGTDIPLGARILAVADCFDALTSDRPYRRRLSDAQALVVIADRRGTMYEPPIVDAFIRIYQSTPPVRGRRLLVRRWLPSFQ